MVFGLLYGAGCWIPGLLDLVTNRPYVPTFAVVGSRLGGDAGAYAVLAAGVALVVVCFVIRLWGASYLEPATVWNADANAERLFVQGPFRYTRNPLYLGNIFLAAGMGCLAPPLGFAIIVIGNALLVRALISHEEPILRARFGQQYLSYSATVPRLWPSLRRAPEIGSFKPSLAQGLRSEIGMASLVFAMCSIFAGIPYGLIGFCGFGLAGLVARRLMG
jgi:protein-S-isoprenylcysteine O-methyltransferase Ste14